MSPPSHILGNIPPYHCWLPTEQQSSIYNRNQLSVPTANTCISTPMVKKELLQQYKKTHAHDGNQYPLAIPNLPMNPNYTVSSVIPPSHLMKIHDVGRPGTNSKLPRRRRLQPIQDQDWRYEECPKAHHIRNIECLGHEFIFAPRSPAVSDQRLLQRSAEKTFNTSTLSKTALPRSAGPNVWEERPDGPI